MSASYGRTRKASEFRRIYGSKERVEWVASLPCAGCGRKGECHNHHIANGGMGRKADASTIVPLCAACHRMVHDIGAKRFEKMRNLDFSKIADTVERAWQSKPSRRASHVKHTGGIQAKPRKRGARATE